MKLVLTYQGRIALYNQPMDYTILFQFIRQQFNLDPHTITILFLDDEGDQITVVSQEELEVLLAIYEEKEYAKVIVQGKMVERQRRKSIGGLTDITAAKEQNRKQNEIVIESGRSEDRSELNQIQFQTKQVQDVKYDSASNSEVGVQEQVQVKTENAQDVKDVVKKITITASQLSLQTANVGSEILAEEQKKEEIKEQNQPQKVEPIQQHSSTQKIEKQEIQTKKSQAKLKEKPKPKQKIEKKAQDKKKPKVQQTKQKLKQLSADTLQTLLTKAVNGLIDVRLKAVIPSIRDNYDDQSLQPNMRDQSQQQALKELCELLLIRDSKSAAETKRQQVAKKEEEKKKAKEIAQKLVFLLGGNAKDYIQFATSNSTFTITEAVLKYGYQNGISPSELQQRDIIAKCNHLANKFKKQSQQFIQFVIDHQSLQVTELVTKFKQIEKEAVIKKKEEANRQKEEAKQLKMKEKEQMLKQKEKSLNKRELNIKKQEENLKKREEAIKKQYEAMKNKQKIEQQEQIVNEQIAMQKNNQNVTAANITNQNICQAENIHIFQQPEASVIKQSSQIKQQTTIDLPIIAEPIKIQNKSQKIQQKAAEQKQQKANIAVVSDIPQSHRQIYDLMVQLFGQQSKTSYIPFIQHNFRLGKEKIIDLWFDLAQQ